MVAASSCNSGRPETLTSRTVTSAGAFAEADEVERQVDGGAYRDAGEVNAVSAAAVCIGDAVTLDAAVSVPLACRLEHGVGVG